MKKSIILTTLMSVISGLLVAQASLPTSWDFSNTPTPPTGWSYDLGTGSKTVYTAGSFVHSNPALRLDFTSEYVQIHFADEPGNFVYHIAGTGASPWQGTVQVQESVNGSSFTTIRTYNAGDINSSSRKDSVTLQASSRYARIFFATKTSGYNLAIDDAIVRKAPPKPQAEIDVVYKGKDVISGKTLQTGNKQIGRGSGRGRGVWGG